MRWCCVFGTVLVTSCASPSHVEMKPDVQRASDIGMPIMRNTPDDTDVIGKLVTHDRVLTIVGSGNGPRFWVSTRDGRVLSQELTADELTARHRDLADVYRVGTARAYLDASLDSELLESPTR